jgi:hypothetical protein
MKRDDEPKIAKLIKMLSSSNDGEVLAAARAIVRTEDIHELAKRAAGGGSPVDLQVIREKAFREGKDAAAAEAGFRNVDGPSFYEMACEIQRKANGRLRPNERNFVDDMARWCAPETVGEAGEVAS